MQPYCRLKKSENGKQKIKLATTENRTNKNKQNVTQKKFETGIIASNHLVYLEKRNYGLAFIFNDIIAVTTTEIGNTKKLFAIGNIM